MYPLTDSGVIDVPLMTDEIDVLIRACPGKMFSWEWRTSSGEAMTGVTHGEWMEWSRERQEDLIRGLVAIGLPWKD